MIDEYFSPDDLRRVVSTLLVTVGAIMIFVLFAFIVVPGLRNANKPEAAPPVAAPQGETGWLDPTEYPPSKGYELAAVDPETVLVASPALLDRGKQLYQQNCAACHGPAGQGDGPAAQGLNPPPRNFTDAEGWKNGSQLTGIYKTLSEGIPGSAMVSYSYLAGKDRMALAHYVQSLGSFAHPSDDPAVLDALAKEFSSGGERVPNKIPVSMAIDKLASEFAGAKPLALPPPETEPRGLLARLVVNPARAAQTLAQSTAWRVSTSALAELIVPGAPENGFALSVATLGPQGWRTLHRELFVATGTPLPEGAAALPIAPATGSAEAGDVEVQEGDSALPGQGEPVAAEAATVSSSEGTP